MKTSRLSLGFSLLLLALCVCLMGADKPNIVIISASNLGYSDLGCYGSEIRTPAIDKLAEEGMQFTQFYQCGNNSMSQTALMTGQYPHRVGMGMPMVDLEWKGYQGSIRKSTVTVAKFLKSVGYSTLLSGKWGLTRHYQPGSPSFAWPLNAGFDHFYGTILPQTSYFEPQFLTMNDQPYSSGDGYYHTYAIASEAVHFLNQSSGSGKPFFLYVAFTAPSWPLHAPEEEIKRYERQYAMGWDQTRALRFDALKKRALVPYGTVLPDRDERVADWNRVGAYGAWHARRMQVYAAQISAMDRGVSMILEKIHQMGAENNTLIIFLSDAGACADELSEKTRSRFIPKAANDGSPVHVGNVPSARPGSLISFQSYGVPWANVSNTPLRGYAESVYEGGITSPCIIHWPDHAEPGKVVEPAHVIDILPTIVELSGNPFPETLDGYDTLAPVGKSLVPLFSTRTRMDLMTQEDRKNRYFFWECKGNAAVRHGQWKLVLPANGRQWELYNLMVDRTESQNLYPRFQTDPEITKMISKYEIWKKTNRVQNWDDVLAKLRPLKRK